jgi:hypothetical protein
MKSYHETGYLKVISKSNQLLSGHMKNVNASFLDDQSAGNIESMDIEYA